MTYNILSPDGVAITPNDYTSKAGAIKAFDQWQKRFALQGYYSSGSGRIPLDELKSECQLITIKNGEIINTENL